MFQQKRRNHMTLFKEWQDLIGNQTDTTFQKFWEEYAGAEIKIYKDVLTNHKKSVEGTFRELADKYQVSDVLFMGWLDGVNSSMKKSMSQKALDSVTADTAIKFNINYEKLYHNMLEAKAEHLHSLSEWDGVLEAEKRAEITKEFKKSQIVRKEETPGRNDPCSCGSGKKYKKCCGA